MHTKIFSWAAVFLLLALPLALMIFAHTTDPQVERTSSPGSKIVQKAVAESTQRMAHRLRQLSEQIDVAKVLWGANERRVKMFREELAAAKDVNAQLNAEFSLADELLKDGQNEECLLHLDQIESRARNVAESSPPRIFRISA
jgi:hypothetical protein